MFLKSNLFMGWESWFFQQPLLQSSCHMILQKASENMLFVCLGFFDEYKLQKNSIIWNGNLL